MKEMSKPFLRLCEADDLDALSALMGRLGHDKQPDYAHRLMVEQKAGKRLILLAFVAESMVGFGVYNMFPSYGPFARLKIPEIQDVHIDPLFRKKGIATALIKWCESTAAAAGHELIGIGVGQTPEYEAAQRLYTSLGYVPDGGPVMVEEGGSFDNLLCLMMTKSLE